jgi:COMM domain containing 10
MTETSAAGPQLFAASNSALQEQLEVLSAIDPQTLEAVVGELCARLVREKGGNGGKGGANAGQNEADGASDGGFLGLFDAGELNKLRGTLGLTEDEDALPRALSSALFVVEQTAYFDLSPAQLTAQLVAAQLSAGCAKAFGSAWETHRTDLIRVLRAQSIAPRTLSDVAWRLHLQVSQSNMSRLKEPTALVELGLKAKSEDGRAPKDDKLLLEFNHSELADLFQKLEVVQEQLDKIG